jgi:hexosaminidase
MNVLQLHLTDDQGWRIEVKSLPQFTAVQLSGLTAGRSGRASLPVEG